MRFASLAVALGAAVMALSGCFGGSDGHEHEEFTCPDGTILDLADIEGHDDEGFDPLDECPNTAPSPTTTTPPTPNELPVLVLTVTDDLGNATSVTILGGNLTFSAAGSSDPDGTLVGAAIVVQDSNQTRAAPLFANGKFVPVTFGFDRPGVVNVTVNLIDDRAGFTVNQTQVFVNHPQAPDSFGMKLIGPPVASADDCAGPAGNDILDSNYYKEFSFDVAAGATYVEATVAAGSASIAICGPDRVAMSAAGSGTVVSSNNGTLAPAPGAETPYFVAALSGAPNQSVAVTILVHYEPRPAA